MTPRDQAEAKMLCRKFSDELEDFVMRRYRYVSKSVRPTMSNSIHIRRGPISLSLRFRPLAKWPNDSIVIATIEFGKQRKGHGTALLKFLADTAPRYGVRSIGLEQTHDGDDIQGFVAKFGFESYESNRDWLVPLAVLQERLAAHVPPTTPI